MLFIYLIGFTQRRANRHFQTAELQKKTRNASTIIDTDTQIVVRAHYALFLSFLHRVYM